jgi:outer membrane protein OmpA-like peptidoglycan-associated protein
LRQADLAKAAELYGVGVGQLQAGDPNGQSTIEAANKRFADICRDLGMDDVAQCLSQNGITLPPLPEQPAKPAEPQEKPVADLPGADQEVSPEATEPLPQDATSQDAAPVLDSAKQDMVQGARPDGKRPRPQQPEQQAQQPEAPPQSDKAAQSDLGPVKTTSIEDVKGKEVDPSKLPKWQLPEGVTIINDRGPNRGDNNGRGDNDGRGDNNGRDGNGRGDNNGRGDSGRNDRGNAPDYANNGFIFNFGINLVISNPGQDFDRISRNDRDRVQYEELDRGRVKETVFRPDGVKIVTIRDRWGHVLKRSRIGRDGHEYILAYYDEDRDRDRDDRDGHFGNWRDPGDDLPPLRLTIPIRDYVLDAGGANQRDIERFLSQPPVEQVRQIYTIEDVKRSARIRDSVRRLEIGGLTFDSGSATIARSEVGELSAVANAMLDLLDRNPAETFLIEGHTDATGSDQVNLILSDQRAATVARILTDFYGIPPENLVTQGYGEYFLKVQTQGPERLNRRVTIKRITPLITVAQG